MKFLRDVVIPLAPTSDREFWDVPLEAKPPNIGSALAWLYPVALTQYSQPLSLLTEVHTRLGSVVVRLLASGSLTIVYLMAVVWTYSPRLLRMACIRLSVVL